MSNSIHKLDPIFLIMAGLAGCLAVGTAAIASHADMNPENLRRIDTASHFLFWHALALTGIGFTVKDQGSFAWLRLSGLLFITGIFLFSINLLAMAFLDIFSLRSLTPAGGISFMLGWLCLIPFSLRYRKATNR